MYVQTLEDVELIWSGLCCLLIYIPYVFHLTGLSRNPAAWRGPAGTIVWNPHRSQDGTKGNDVKFIGSSCWRCHFHENFYLILWFLLVMFDFSITEISHWSVGMVLPLSWLKLIKSYLRSGWNYWTAQEHRLEMLRDSTISLFLYVDLPDRHVMDKWMLSFLQIVWLCKELIQNGIIGSDSVCHSLIRQIAGQEKENCYK